MDTSRLMGRALMRTVSAGWRAGRFLKICPAGMGLAWLGGCVSLGAIGGAALVFLLTGFFLTSLQASFAATANSYRFTEFAAPRFGFNTSGSNSNLGTFSGPLPGFHLVIINLDNDKALVSAQAQDDEPQVFQTDLQIEFGGQFTIGGVVRECRVDDDGVMDCLGAPEFPLADFYDIDDVSASVRVGSEPNRFVIRIEVDATGVDAGEALEYVLELDAGLSPDGQRLTGTTNVFRKVTFPGQQPIELESTGQFFSGQKDFGSTEGVSDQGSNSEEDEDEPRDQDEGDGQDSSETSEPSIAEFCPSLPAEAVSVIDEQIACCDYESFDVDGDGLIAVEEVRDLIDPSIVGFGLSLSEVQAGCVAVVANG